MVLPWPSQKLYVTIRGRAPLHLSKQEFPYKGNFICAVVHPRYDSNKRCEFYGRIGCWPLVEYKEAQPKSKNRPAVVLEMKPLTKIDDDVIGYFTCKKIIPPIKKVWPKDMK